MESSVAIETSVEFQVPSTANLLAVDGDASETKAVEEQDMVVSVDKSETASKADDDDDDNNNDDLPTLEVTKEGLQVSPSVATTTAMNNVVAADDAPSHVDEADGTKDESKQRQRQLVPDLPPAQHPGAVAVNPSQAVGQESSPTSSSLPALASSNEAQEGDTSHEVPVATTSAMIVEATAVQEILATEVIAEREPVVQQHPAGLSIQHVDIDNFDDAPHHHRTGGGDLVENGDDPEQAMHIQQQRQGLSKVTMMNPSSAHPFPPVYQIAFVVLVIIVFFVLLCFVIFGLTAQDVESAIGDDDDPLRAECIETRDDVLSSLNQLVGFAWIEYTLASVVFAVIVYHFLSVFQEVYCTTLEHPTDLGAIRTTAFFTNLAICLLEFLWLLILMAIMVYIGLDDLRDPAERVKEACTAPETGNEEIVWEHSAGDLKAYRVACSPRVAQLLFLLLARGRLLFRNGSCDHIAPFWKKFWFWIKIVMEIELFVLVAVFHHTCLLPLRSDIENFEP